MAVQPSVKVYFDGGCRPAPVGMETAVVVIRHARQLMLRYEKYDVRSYSTCAALLADTPCSPQLEGMMRKLKWWHWALIAFVGLIVLSSIFAPPPKKQAPTASSIFADANAKFEPISGDAIFAMTSTQAPVRKHCQTLLELSAASGPSAKCWDGLTRNTRPAGFR